MPKLRKKGHQLKRVDGHSPSLREGHSPKFREWYTSPNSGRGILVTKLRQGYPPKLREKVLAQAPGGVLAQTPGRVLAQTPGGVLVQAPGGVVLQAPGVPPLEPLQCSLTSRSSLSECDHRARRRYAAAPAPHFGNVRAGRLAIHPGGRSSPGALLSHVVVCLLIAPRHGARTPSLLAHARRGALPSGRKGKGRSVGIFGRVVSGTNGRPGGRPRGRPAGGVGRVAGRRPGRAVGRHRRARRSAEQMDRSEHVHEAAHDLHYASVGFLAQESAVGGRHSSWRP